MTRQSNNPQSLLNLMLSIGVLLAATLPVPGAAGAAEGQINAVGRFNWIPSDSTKEDPGFRSVAVHNIHKIVLTTLENGRLRLDVTLPEDLTAGELKVIVLAETGRRPDPDLDDVNALEVNLAGPNGRFVCKMYESHVNGCEVEFISVSPDSAHLRTFLTTKYGGTGKMFGQSLLADHIEAEPFGSISINEPDVATEISNGHWNTVRTDAALNTQNIFMNIDFQEGMLRRNGINGRILLDTDNFDGEILNGSWSFGDERGELSIKIMGDHFEGTWKFDDSPVPAGYWSGNRVR